MAGIETQYSAYHLCKKKINNNNETNKENITNSKSLIGLTDKLIKIKFSLQLQ